MNIEQFRKILVGVLLKRLGKDYTVMPCETLKNNGLKLYGVILRKDNKKIAPTIYIESIFRDYLKKGDINKAADEVIAINKEYETEEFDTTFYESFERVKDNLYVKLISRDENAELLTKTPHRDFMDLSLIVYCDASSVCKFDASIVVKDEHVRMWGVDKEDIIDFAIDNTRGLGCSIRDVSEFFKEHDTVNNSDMEIRRKMYVMSNRNLFYGAICMTYDDRLDEFCNKYKCGTYIIPSSIHEVILVPDTGDYTGKEINSMIEDVNKTELKREEILSNHAYYYSVQDGYTLV